MATEEQLNNPQPPDSSFPAATAAPPFSLPQYPEMILAAIEALNEKEGSNKSSISKHIEATYGNLPAAHSTLLSHHLNKMKASGQLVFLKNNYTKPDPDAPPRRGRGRPPKPKKPLSPGAVSPSPRPRGRPPKQHDPTATPPSPKINMPPSSSGTSTGRKRGRPRKTPKPDAPSKPAGTGRGRGRPPKVKQQESPALAPVGA